MAYRFSSMIAGLFAGISLASVGAAGAQSVEEFYKGNTVKLIISANAGGGLDFYSRAVAPFLTKHIPGNPNIVVSNLPGAGGMKAAIQMQANGAKDGSEIFVLQRNNLYRPLISSQQIAFDPVATNWIGSLNSEVYVVVVRSDSDVKTKEDLFTKPLKIGATTAGNEAATIPGMMNEYLGTKFDVVLGYSGGGEINLALQRGEIEGRVMAADSILGYGAEADMLKAGEIKVLMQTALEPEEAFPDAPSVFEYIKDPDVTRLARFMLAPLVAGRPLAMPADVPADRLAAIRAAFDAAVADPDYIAELAKTGVTAEPISGQAVEDIVDELYSTPEPLLAKLKVIVNQ